MNQSHKTATKTFQVTILTLFPELFPGPLAASLSGQALQKKQWSLKTLHFRDYATNNQHRSVDDTPFGGGSGMIMRPDVIGKTIDAAIEQKATLPLIYLSPRGDPLKQQTVKTLAKGQGMTLICGRFEGIDQRVLEAYDIMEISMGDYLLSGGELAAMALVDACVRLQPGVIGSKKSLEEESFEHGLLEYSHYTRPACWKERQVPEILLSGHHARIQSWRLENAREITKKRRPDLWESYCQNLKHTH